MPISNLQIRMARAALGIGVRELSDLADCSKDTISRIEKNNIARPSTLRAIQKAFEDAGIEFIHEDKNGGVGVRLKHAGPAEKPDRKQAETE